VPPRQDAMKIYFQKREYKETFKDIFFPPIYCHLYPPSFRLPAPQSLKQTSLRESVATSWTDLRKSIPPFSLPGVGEVDYVDENFFRPVPGTLPVDGLVVADVIFLVLLPDIFFVDNYLICVHIFIGKIFTKNEIVSPSRASAT
jgi:hypothetical protein